MANETMNGLHVKLTIQGTVIGTDGRKQVVDITYDRSFADGTGAQQCQSMFYDSARALNATNETLDLDGLADFQGATMSDTVGVKLMFVKNNSTTAGDEVTLFGGDFSSPMGDASDKIKVGPDGILLLISPVDGYTVAATTGDGLLVATDYNGTYDILLATDNS